MKKKTNFGFGMLAVVIALAMLFTTVLSAGADSATISEDEISAIVNTATDSSLVTSPFITVAEQVRNSVVGVNNYTVRSNSFYGYGFGYGYGYGDGVGRETLAGTGSGVVITKYGHVLTNYHVIEDASRLTVTIANDESEHEAIVAGYDEDLDVAVLLVPDLKLTPVPLGDSDQLQVGEWAIVIGNPLGEEFARTTTVGVVSALDREVTDTGYDRYGRRTNITNTMIQVDAAINSGNSGGGMFNVLGQLQGIPARKYSASGFSSTTIDNIGMCIPINVAKPLIESVLRAYNGSAPGGTGSAASGTNGTVESPLHGKPRLGVTGTTLNSTGNGKVPLGAFITSVDAGSPADNGGMKAGDIIVEVDGTVISNMTALQNKLATYNEGDVITVKVFRDEGLAKQVDKQYITLSEIGEGEYLDLTITLRIVDNLNM